MLTGPLPRPALAVRDLRCRFDDPPALALGGVSLAVARGELVTVMGASGAGKSTLLRCVNGLVPSMVPADCDGEIVLDGIPVLGREVGALAGRVAMVFQDFEAQLFSTNVRLEVAFGPGQLGVPSDEIACRVDAALAMVDLADCAGRDPWTLSGGQKQRLAVASILAMAPAVILLDEAATDLDPLGRRELYATLQRLRGEITLVAVEHEIEPVMVSDRLCLMREGRIVASGRPHTLARDVALFLECGVRPHDLALLGSRLGVELPLEVEAAVEELRRLQARRAAGAGATTHPLCDAPAEAAQPPREAPAEAAHPVRDAAAQAARPVCEAASQVGPPVRDALAQAAHPVWGTVSQAGRPVRDAAASPKPPPGASHATPPLPARPILEVAGLSCTYGGGPTVLDGIDLAIGPGEFVAIIGQNGCGKTTLAKHLNGLLHAERGSVRLDGADIRGLALERVAPQVGYVFQNPDHQLFAATVAEEVAFGPRNFGCTGAELEGRVRDTLAEVDLLAQRDRDPFLLSKGERQRLAVATVLALAPRVLILDEPTTGLDYPQQRRMLDLLARLRARGTTIIVITHSPWVVVEYAERALLLRAGRLVFDGPLGRLLEDEALLRSAAFDPPPITRVARALGVHARTVDELVAALGLAARGPAP